MIEVENRGIRKSKVNSIVVIAIIVALAVSSLWLIVRVVGLEMDVDSLQTTKSSLRTSVDNLQRKVDSLTNEKKTLEGHIDSLENTNDDLQVQVDSLQTGYNMLNDSYSLLNQTWENLEQNYTRVQTENTQLQWEISSLESQVEYWQEVAEEKEEFMFYYDPMPTQRYGFLDLEEYLDRWEWVEDTYIEDVFDCSEMSAYVERNLENEGYHTYIVLGEAPWGGEHHAWLLVETSEGHYMPVEATEYALIKWDDPYFDNYFVYDYEFETIFDALEYYYEEFDWWAS